MIFFKRSEKKKAPDQLPGLLVDSIEKAQAPQEVKAEPSLPASGDAPVSVSIPSSSPSSPQLQVLTTKPEFKPKSLAAFQSQNIYSEKELKSDKSNESGFFKDLFRSVTEDTKNLDKLEQWYESRFEEEDIVHQMRSYWEKQKPHLILNTVTGDLKGKLMEKTDHLHVLEQQWQTAYINLITKEDEIRAEEKELKELLSEFVSIYKKHLVKDKKKSPAGKDK